MKKITFLVLLFSLAACGNTGFSPNLEIHSYVRDSSSGTRESLEKQLDFSGETSNRAIETSNNGDMLTKVSADVSSIGYVSFDTHSDKVTTLPINGVMPTIDHVLDGTYDLQRPYEFVTRAEGDFESNEKQALITAFLDYMLNSTEGLMTIQRYGGIVDVDTGTPWESLKKKHPIVERDNSSITIISVGSTSVEPIVKALLESFEPLAGDFHFVMNQSGSGDGYKRVLGSEKNGPNRGDIGFASRNFKEEEHVSEGLFYGTMCIDAIKIIVNNENTVVDDISSSDIRNIYIGEYRKWNEVVDNE